MCLECPGEAGRCVRKTLTALWSPACARPACVFPCSQISLRTLAFASPVTLQMCISPASSSCPLFFFKVSHKYLSLLLDRQGGTGTSSLSGWTKNNCIFGSSLCGKMTYCWSANATGLVPLPGVWLLLVPCMPDGGSHRTVDSFLVGEEL